MEKCNFCEESRLNIGEKTDYGAVIIFRIGDNRNGWFATLSPKTGGDPEQDFSIQIMPFNHLKYFSEINNNPELAKNYGVIFAKINHAVAEIIKEKDSKKIPLCTYGKCKHEDEHIHLKIFPYRGDMAQPFTSDSSFGKKEVYNEEGQEFIKMKPVRKVKIDEERFRLLSKKLIEILQ